MPRAEMMMKIIHGCNHIQQYSCNTVATIFNIHSRVFVAGFSLFNSSKCISINYKIMPSSLFLLFFLIYACGTASYVLFMHNTYFYGPAHIFAENKKTNSKFYFCSHGLPYGWKYICSLSNWCSHYLFVWQWEEGSDFPRTLVISEKLDFFEIPSKLSPKVLLGIQPSQLLMPSISVSTPDINPF